MKNVVYTDPLAKQGALGCPKLTDSAVAPGLSYIVNYYIAGVSNDPNSYTKLVRVKNPSGILLYGEGAGWAFINAAHLYGAPNSYQFQHRHMRMFNILYADTHIGDVRKYVTYSDYLIYPVK